MRKILLALLLAGSATAASTIDIPVQMKKSGIPVTQKNGIRWATITEPYTGEQVSIGFYGNAPAGKVSRSISLLYEGFSFDGGMYGIGYLTGALTESCLGQKLEPAEDAAVFVQNAVQQGLKNGAGTFSKTFGGLRYTVKASHYANGRMRILLTTNTSPSGKALCSF